LLLKNVQQPHPTYRQLLRYDHAVNMSFGFAVGDFVAVGTLAWDVYKACKGSPDGFKNISMEVLSLHAVLKEAEETILTRPLSASREARLKTISYGCTCVLEDLQKLIDRYESLGTKSKRTWDRVGWGLENINELRSRLTSNVVLLNAFLRFVYMHNFHCVLLSNQYWRGGHLLIHSFSTSQVAVEKQLEALLREYREGRRESSIASTRTVESLSLDEKQAWRAIRKELEDIRITVAAFDANKDFIIDWFAKAVASGSFQEQTQQNAPSGARLDESFEKQCLENEHYPASLDGSQDDLTRSVSENPTWSSSNSSNTDVIMSQALRNTSFQGNKDTTGDHVSNDHPPEKHIIQSTTPTDTAIGDLSAAKIVRGVPKGASRDDASVSFARNVTPHRPHIASSSVSENVLPRNLSSSLNSPKSPVQSSGSAFGVSTEETLTKARISRVAALIARLSRPQNTLLTAIKEGNFRKVQGIFEDEAKARLLSHEFLGYALQAASYSGSEQIVRLLLEKGVGINAHGNALQAASRGGNEQIVRLLLDKGADVHAQVGIDGNALHTASRYGHEKIVRLLLEKGADVNAKGGLYGSALWAAIKSGNELVVCLLLDEGVDVHARDSVGNALHLASLNGHEQIVRLLLEEGFDVHAEGGYWGDSLQCARIGGNQNIIQLLEREMGRR